MASMKRRNPLGNKKENARTFTLDEPAPAQLRTSHLSVPSMALALLPGRTPLKRLPGKTLWA